MGLGNQADVRVARLSPLPRACEARALSVNAMLPGISVPNGRALHLIESLVAVAKSVAVLGGSTSANPEHLTRESFVL